MSDQNVQKLKQPVDPQTQAIQNKMYAMNMPNENPRKDISMGLLDPNSAVKEGEYSPTPDLNQVPVGSRDMIQDLSTKQASMNAIKSKLDSAMSMWNQVAQRAKEENRPFTKQESEQLAQIGSGIVGTLNSPDNPNPLSKEEAERLSSLLKDKTLNISQPGSMFGRDLDRFQDQLVVNENKMGENIKRNDSTIKYLYGIPDRDLTLETRAKAGLLKR